MRICRPADACLSVLFVVLLVTSYFPSVASGGGTRDELMMLVVGEQEKMKTRNPLPVAAADRWTADVLERVYDSVGQMLSDTEQLMPYIVKGVDADDDGVFEVSGYGVLGKAVTADQLNVTAYYDFNGVYFHDGVQVDVSDILFSYQLNAMNPRSNSHMRALMDKAGKAGSNYSTTRWLFIAPATKNWQNEPTVGSASLRVAVRFHLQEPFVLFYRTTLTRYTLFPRHVWEGVGWRDDVVSPGCSMTNPCRIEPLHTDFGRAIYPESDPRFGQGIPVSDPQSYEYLKSETPAADSAEEWQMGDAEVIGTGPFRFESFDPVTGVAVVKKNSLFYTGKDPKTGVMLDSYVAGYIHQPYIDGITFQVFATAILGIIALEGGQTDFYHWSLAPEWVPTLINNPNIRLWTAPEPGFSYLAYNMRRPTVGNWNWSQADRFDVGLHFRKAVAHLIDKATIVKNLLQGYGVPGVVPVSPRNERFYNESLSGYAFSPTLALQELGLAHQDAVWLSQNSGPAEAADWYALDPGTGKIVMPGLGTASFNLWCPNADYDPTLVNSCTMLANEMNKLGIHVRAKPSAFSAITQLINAHDFDMYMSSWKLGDSDPDYLHSLFHSSNAASGFNYPGFDETIMDWILDETRTEMDDSARASLFKWAQGVLLDKLPYDVLYFRTNMEATRHDRFVGWIQKYGTVWNYWSLLEIRSPRWPGLAVGLEAPSAIASGDARTIVVNVTYAGYPIGGANVTLSVNPDWAGNFTGCDGPPGNVCNRTTTGEELSVIYQAPSVSDSVNITITATARYRNLGEASRSMLVTVLPVGISFLALTTKALDGDVIGPNGGLRFGITVTTHEGLPKDDAEVTASLDPWLDPLYGVWPISGTASEMARITFIAPPASQLPSTENPFTLTIQATFAGYYPATATLGILATKRMMPPVAFFTVSPLTGDTTTIFTFNASGSSDSHDPVSALEVRWDWESDGTWDTAWSTNKTANHQYAQSGTYTVRIEVRDLDDYINITTRSVTVIPPKIFGLSLETIIMLIVVAVAVAVSSLLVVYLLRRGKAGGSQPKQAATPPPTETK